MAKRKRTSRQSNLVGRAFKAGRQALREAEKRIPPDLRRQVQRRLKDADKTARAAIKQLEIQARKASTRTDVNSVLKRIDGLTKQARQAIQGSGSRTSTTRRRTAATARRAVTRAKKAATTTRRKVAARATTTTRRTAPARRRRTAPPAAMPETMAPDAGGSIDTGTMSET